MQAAAGGAFIATLHKGFTRVTAQVFTGDGRQIQCLG